MVEYMLQRGKKNVEQFILYGSNYAKDLLVSIGREIEQKGNYKIKIITWSDLEFIYDKYLLAETEFNKKRTMFIYVREPIENYHDLIRTNHDSALIREKYKQWIYWSNQIKYEYALIAQIDYPSIYRGRYNLSNRNLQKDFVCACTCNYQKMFSDMLLLYNRLRGKKRVDVFFDKHSHIWFFTNKLNFTSDMFWEDGCEIVFPCGEVYWGIQHINTMNGTFCSRDYGKVYIVNGIIKNVDSKKMKEYIDGRIVEFGIGINKQANEYSYVSLAEKSKKAVHIGITKKNQANNEHIDLISKKYYLYADYEKIK